MFSLLNIPNFISTTFTFRYLSLVLPAYYLSIARCIDPYIRRFVSPCEHSHRRYFVAPRHILCHMISHLGIVLPTLPGSIHIHAVTILCMQEYQTVCFKLTWQLSFQTSDIQLYFPIQENPPISCLCTYKETFRTYQCIIFNYKITNPIHMIII